MYGVIAIYGGIVVYAVIDQEDVHLLNLMVCLQRRE